MHELWKIVPNKGLVDQMTVAIGSIYQSIYLSIDLSLSTVPLYLSIQ